MAVLLTNCHLEYFWENISLKNRLNIINRTAPFMSLIDVIDYFDMISSDPVTLITITTYDYLIDKQDIQEALDTEHMLLKKVLLLNVKEFESSTEFESLLTAFLLNTNH
eukprot:180882_1